jgi:glycosyltransferase involved in cell wall biosynthesis
MYPPVSVVITTYNRSEKIKKCLDHLLKIDYPDYEIIVVNDGSTDETQTILKKYEKKHPQKIRIITHPNNKGFSQGNNTGIKNAKNEFIAFMTDDGLVKKNWLKILMSGFTSDKIAGTAGTWKYQYTSSCWRKKILEEIGMFDIKFSGCYREDTDLAFRIEELSYEIKEVKGAGFIHDHPAPPSLKGKIRYGLKRIMSHQWDVLLFKKHTKKSIKFFDIKFGFIRNPIKDFQIATGLWSRKKRKINLSSPQGIVFIENKTIFHILVIFLMGIFYTFGVKYARFVGSLKFNKFLI